MSPAQRGRAGEGEADMPEFYQAASMLLGLAATAISLLVGWGTLKARRDEPSEKRWADLDKWRKDTDEWRRRIDSSFTEDNGERWDSYEREREKTMHQIAQLERLLEQSADFQIVMLKSIKGMLSHMSTGNDVGLMKALDKEIDEFLLDLLSEKTTIKKMMR
jgi:hypothetical protein